MRPTSFIVTVLLIISSGIVSIHFHFKIVKNVASIRVDVVVVLVYYFWEKMK